MTTASILVAAAILAQPMLIAGLLAQRAFARTRPAADTCLSLVYLPNSGPLGALFLWRILHVRVSAEIVQTIGETPLDHPSLRHGDVDPRPRKDRNMSKTSHRIAACWSR